MRHQHQQFTTLMQLSGRCSNQQIVAFKTHTPRQCATVCKLPSKLPSKNTLAVIHTAATKVRAEGAWRYDTL